MQSRGSELFEVDRSKLDRSRWRACARAIKPFKPRFTKIYKANVRFGPDPVFAAYQSKPVPNRLWVLYWVNDSECVCLSVLDSDPSQTARPNSHATLDLFKIMAQRHLLFGNFLTFVIRNLTFNTRPVWCSIRTHPCLLMNIYTPLLLARCRTVGYAPETRLITDLSVPESKNAFYLTTLRSSFCATFLS